MNESELILETWRILVQYINKDKQVAADHLVGVLSDMGVEEEVLGTLMVDNYLKSALEDLGLDEDLLAEEFWEDEDEYN